MLNLTFEHWIIFITVSILILCIIEIRKLKKTIFLEVQKRLVPQLAVEFESKDIGLFLKNEGCLLARDIQVDDLPVILEDFGFEMGFILKFDHIEFLKPNDRIKLKFMILRREEEVKADISGKVILNLMTQSFKIKVGYSNIENIRFRSTFAKRKDKFYIENVETL